MFAILDVENIVQVGDKTRLNASKSFGAEFTSIEISPEDGADFIVCTDDQYLDWSYSVAGLKTVTLRLTSASGTKEATKQISVLTESEDALFSSDSDLKEVESQIERYLEQGRVTFLNKHRAAKKEILKSLRDNGSIDQSKTDLVGLALNMGALKSCSCFTALALIFGSENTGFGVGGESYFKSKSIDYRILAKNEFSKIILGKDSDGDNKPDEEVPSIFDCVMVRR